MPVFVVMLPRFVADPFDPLGDHVHGGVQVQGFPFGAVRRPIEDLVDAVRSGDELHARRTLWAEVSPRNRRIWIALDMAHLAVPDMHLLCAADGTVGAHTVDHRVIVVGAGMQTERPGRHGGLTKSLHVAVPELFK